MSHVVMDQIYLAIIQSIGVYTVYCIDIINKLRLISMNVWPKCFSICWDCRSGVPTDQYSHLSQPCLAETLPTDKKLYWVQNVPLEIHSKANFCFHSSSRIEQWCSDDVPSAPLHLMCFLSVNFCRFEACTNITAEVYMRSYLTPCINDCGTYGQCKLLRTNNYLYAACECKAGKSFL